jgi:hypothetical protein
MIKTSLENTDASSRHELLSDLINLPKDGEEEFKN